MFEYFNKFGFKEGQRVLDAFLEQARELYGKNVSISVDYYKPNEVMGSNSHWIDYVPTPFFVELDKSQLNEQNWQKAGDVKIYAANRTKPSEEFGILTFKNGQRRKEANISFFQCKTEFPFLVHRVRTQKIQAGFKKKFR